MIRVAWLLAALLMLSAGAAPTVLAAGADSPPVDTAGGDLKSQWHEAWQTVSQALHEMNPIRLIGEAIHRALRVQIITAADAVRTALNAQFADAGSYPHATCAPRCESPPTAALARAVDAYVDVTTESAPLRHYTVTKTQVQLAAWGDRGAWNATVGQHGYIAFRGAANGSDYTLFLYDKGEKTPADGVAPFSCFNSGGTTDCPPS